MAIFTSCGGVGYSILADKLDIGIGFQVSPCKIEVTKNTQIPITIYNITDKLKSFVLSVRTPDKLTDGYLAHDTEDAYTIQLGKSYIIVEPHSEVIIYIDIQSNGKRDNREAWICITEENSVMLKGELVVRILLKI